jgi:hypothetical protein
MKNRISGILLFSTALFIMSLFTGCSSSPAIQSPAVGVVQVVGNEPFIKLAVNINNKDVYFLECTKEVQDELMKNQNKVYEIIFITTKKSAEGITLVVDKVIPKKTK